MLFKKMFIHKYIVNGAYFSKNKNMLLCVFAANYLQERYVPEEGPVCV